MPTRTCAFPASGYTIDAVQRAAYKFVDRFTIDLEDDATEIRCVVVTFTADEAAADGLLLDFKAEVLDQALRGRIRAETEPIRNVILAAAFAHLALDDE
jgi:His-Xaa-Ser system protein HxsD